MTEEQVVRVPADDKPPERAPVSFEHRTIEQKRDIIEAIIARPIADGELYPLLERFTRAIQLMRHSNSLREKHTNVRSNNDNNDRKEE